MVLCFEWINKNKKHAGDLTDVAGPGRSPPGDKILDNTISK